MFVWLKLHLSKKMSIQNKRMSEKIYNLFIELWFHLFNRINIDVLVEDPFLGTISLSRSFSEYCSLNVSWMFIYNLFFFSLQINAQYRPNYPSPYLQREVFVLNLEDGFFGCQVNESVDILQLFELSKLCDGIPQCFLGSDEVANELKCTDRSK